MQKKLESYFRITPKYDERTKKCFIYDSNGRRAFFASSPDPTDKFVVVKSHIKLFYRDVGTTKDIADIPTIESKYSIPLVKSNLQKAIRRCDSQIAVQSALVLIQQAPMEFLRRLPIIYIEDVCLMDSYSIVVWLMMADRDYGKLKNIDIDTLLNIVISLCECRSYFPYVANELNYAYSHETLQYCLNGDQLLCVYYRSEYGGMKGDMEMLKVAIDYYRMHPGEVKKTEYNNINYGVIERNIEIIVEAIDFHPYPQMLGMLSRMTMVNKEKVKEFIWNVESGYNIRKQETIDQSKMYEDRNEWKKIEKCIEDVRCELVRGA
jgi:hypothetical protein